MQELRSDYEKMGRQGLEREIVRMEAQVAAEVAGRGGGKGGKGAKGPPQTPPPYTPRKSERMHRPPSKFSPSSPEGIAEARQYKTKLKQEREKKERKVADLKRELKAEAAEPPSEAEAAAPPDAGGGDMTGLFT